MSRIQLTFETLVTTPIDCAVDLLIDALSVDEQSTRDRALKALVRRGDARSASKILEHWDRLSAEDIEEVRTNRSIFANPIEERLGGDGEGIETAIGAARQLGLTSTVQSLITIAESSDSEHVRMLAGESIVTLVYDLGILARANRDKQTTRGPLLIRLAESVNNYSAHKNDALIEAFLTVAAWSDPELRTVFERPGPTRDVVCARLEKTIEPGPIDLLAGFIKRRELAPCVAKVIQGRNDKLFRDALLKYVSGEAGSAASRNLQNIGLPRCCRGGQQLVDEVAVDQLSSLIYLYVAASQDTVEKLQVIATAAARDSAGCMTAAAFGFSQAGTPDVEFWMRAAMPVADENESAIARDEHAQLLQQLIDLLQHRDGGLVRNVRGVLSPLSASNIAPRLEKLGSRSRRKLGKIVSIVDPDAITRVRDALRHPVLAHRLNAIDMADALAAADELCGALAHIVREDHQDARIRVAKTLIHGTDRRTLQLLEDMTRLPDCGVRDAALAALEKRQASNAR